MMINLINPTSLANHGESCIRAQDQDIRFEENEHQYFVRDENFVSCTTFIKSFFAPFDQVAVSQYCVRKKRPLISDEELEVESSKLRETWTQASTDGTKMHESFENYLNFGTLHQSREMDQFLPFIRSMQEQGFKPYRSEWAVYDLRYKLAGTIDQLFYRDDDVHTLYMYDWKRSKNISTYSFGKLGRLLNFHLNDCNYVHYSLQQNMYRYILEQNYGKRVLSMHLYVINSKSYRAQIIEIPDMQQEIQNMLTYRNQFMQSTQDRFQEFLDSLESL